MKPFSINIRGQLFRYETPVVMGIINITPDSFYANSRTQSTSEAVDRAKQLVANGAQMLDIGAFSTRPGASDVNIDEELRRLEAAIKPIREAVPDVPLSVDTFRAEVARRAVEWGADIINDISGGNLDPEMFDTVAALGVPYVLCHSRGTLADMMEYTDYECVTRDVLAELGDRLQQLAIIGVNDVIVDPGFGFSKTLDQNYQLMADLKIFGLFHRPILVGVSRKSMITNLGADPLVGTTVLSTYAVENGASILRVHDPKAARQAIDIITKIASCQHSE